MAPVSRGRTAEVSYVDSLCFWSPTGEHVYQLADLEVGRGRRTVVDKCRHCGDLAFESVRAEQATPSRLRRLTSRAQRHQGSAPADGERPRHPKRAEA